MIKKMIQYLNYLWYYITRIGSVKKMRGKYTAMDVAQWFLWYNKIQQMDQIQDNYDIYEGLTHLKIQKLLYYAEGVNLAATGNSLFPDKIYAWQHGPVVKNVYDELCGYGKDEIPFNEKKWETIKKMNENPELFGILQTVYNNYAGYTAWQLREKTHVAGGPWQVTVDTKGMQKEISKTLIQEYFQKIVKTYE